MAHIAPRLENSYSPKQQLRDGMVGNDSVLAVLVDLLHQNEDVPASLGNQEVIWPWFRSICYML